MSDHSDEASVISAASQHRPGRHRRRHWQHHRRWHYWPV